MNPLRYLLFISTFFIFEKNILGQTVAKKVIAEHFTNTRCSVCASRNPGFYSALNQNPDVIHIAYHPSSPYSTCLFSTQNKSENDARTKYYGVFGGTPTFVINGIQKSSSDVQDVNVYDPFQNQTTPISVNVSLFPANNDSIKVMIEIGAVSQHNIDSLSLFIPLIEDTVFYNAPNGENQHYDVFRKSFSGENAIRFSAPLFGGPSYIYSASIAKNNLWNLNRLSALVIVSDGLLVIQAEQSPKYNTAFSLPLDWVDVDVRSVNAGHEITWSTTKEVNVSHYEVERSLASDVDFKSIPGEVKAKGNMTDLSKYMLLDNDIDKPGVYLYRVKQSDFDGTITYSKSVKVINIGKLSVNMYPNPTKDDTSLYLKADHDSMIEIEIFDSMGKSVFAIKSSEVKKSSEIVYNLKLDDRPEGFYNVTININGYLTQKKLIKIK